MNRNVLQLVDSFQQGGSERQAVQLVRLLKEHGRYRVFLASLDGAGGLRREVEDLGLGDIPEYRLTSFYDLNALTQLGRMARFLRRNAIDVIHTHDFYTNVFGMAAAAVAGVPVRIASRRETTGCRTPAQKKVERGAYRLAHAIVANARAVKEQLITEGIEASKIVTIYNGLEMARVTAPAGFSRQQALASFGLPTDEPRRFVTIVANLRLEVKDHRTFLRAAQTVGAAVPESAFLIAGEGELTESLHALAEQLGIGTKTFFLGRCDRLPDLLAISDVCVLSSKAEGFSNSILEYMAAGRPVVATDVGGAAEAIIEGETGFLVPTGESAVMAERIIYLLENPEQALALGERGRRRVEQQFSSEAQLESVERLYDQLLASRTPLRLRPVENRSPGGSA